MNMPKKSELRNQVPTAESLRDLVPLEASALVSSQQVDAAHLTGMLSGMLPSLRIESSLVENITGRTARLQGWRMLESVLRSSDLANSDWTGSSFRDCRIERCRLTGWGASQCTFEHVCFFDCRLDMAVFMESTFHKVVFDRCIFTEASFDTADLRNAQFKDCDLRSAVFARAKMGGADLRGSSLAGITARPQDLRGAIIEAPQSVDLVHLLEVRVV